MEISLQFLGAAQNVTGSCYLLNANGKNILVDCGLYQERQFKQRNWEPLPVSPDKIDAIILTHAHLDHCGLLPRLYKLGFRGSVHATAASIDIARIVMTDSAHIQVEDIEFKKKRHSRQNRKGSHPLEPLYNIEDVEGAMKLFHVADYHKPVSLGEGVSATFYDSGHILGSSSVGVKVFSGSESRTIAFSGDLGRRRMPILRDPELFDHADYILCESTYGDRQHAPGTDIKQHLCEIINETRQRGGNVVIPSFAVERSQELLYYINELVEEKCMPQMTIFLDSPMAVKVTEIFKRHPELFDADMAKHIAEGTSPFDLPGLFLVQTANESKAINQIRGTAIIISGSGMCTGGRIKHHLAKNISDPKNTILFVGYQAFGTLGRTILEGEPEVRIFGEMYPVKARIAKINGFSAHADRDELAYWLKGLKQPPRELFVVHGEDRTAHSFAEHISSTLNWKTHVPEYGEIRTLV